MTLREHLQNPECQDLLNRYANQAPFPTEQVLDEMYNVIAKMLSKEREYDEAFPSIYALFAYIKKVSFRALVRRNKTQLQRQLPLDPELAGDNPSPESMLLSALERQTFATILSRGLALEKTPHKIAADLESLLDFLKREGQPFIKTRQSGEERGSLVFDRNALAKAMGWKRNRLYDRLDRLRDLLGKALQEH